MLVEVKAIIDTDVCHYSAGAWRHYSGADLSDVAHLFDKSEITSEEWQQIRGAIGDTAIKEMVDRVWPEIERRIDASLASDLAAVGIVLPPKS